MGSSWCKLRGVMFSRCGVAPSSFVNLPKSTITQSGERTALGVFSSCRLSPRKGNKRSVIISNQIIYMCWLTVYAVSQRGTGCALMTGRRPIFRPNPQYPAPRASQRNTLGL
ncbi:hypothetical protein, unlikely [Trypanosoma brucei gambiense DAL972]|uniref:Uncharacterized protein n=1 Tax=Trypanosoma brucei gambiense (strain MHOM/CI/86/DAL972) TaxID=679716 RepID=D0A512_TRYB9|nr:hypothetical protein, unlikely [Trypanosoma brucei gambiense DAL972]CBH16356.1 hypothetical protein, unlikely [Trypanosoma brucei gambiense DAL972]|eukprot:XP_011778620.1 hypothetical protein, unlikely [Trypanosoma brucei gambiense DAL972]